MVTLRELLRQGALPSLERNLLWQHVLNVSRAWMIAHDDHPVSDADLAAYKALERRRSAGEPMAYLLGHKEFMGHRFTVSPAVLIPRPETELLVETAMQCLKGHSQPAVLDLGTGSGALAVSVALSLPQAKVVATDLSLDALAIAQANAHALGATVTFYPGSWYEALPPGEVFDLIISNPPYISRDDPHLIQGDLRFEPEVALTDGSDGLSSYREIIAQAYRWLTPEGSLFLEHGWDQADRVCGLLESAGFREIHSLPDLAGILRVSGGRL